MKGPGQENGAQLPPACPLEQPPWPKRPSSPRGAYPFPARDSTGGSKAPLTVPGPGTTPSPATNLNTSQQRLIVPSANLGTHPS